MAVGTFRAAERSLLSRLGVQMIGIGAGQQSRVDCVKLAGRKLDTWSAPALPLRRCSQAPAAPLRVGLRRCACGRVQDTTVSSDGRAGAAKDARCVGSRAVHCALGTSVAIPRFLSGSLDLSHPCRQRAEQASPRTAALAQLRCAVLSRVIGACEDAAQWVLPRTKVLGLPFKPGLKKVDRVNARVRYIEGTDRPTAVPLQLASTGRGIGSGHNGLCTRHSASGFSPSGLARTCAQGVLCGLCAQPGLPWSSPRCACAALAALPKEALLHSGASRNRARTCGGWDAETPRAGHSCLLSSLRWVPSHVSA
jgi:hypothetical protein